MVLLVGSHTALMDAIIAMLERETPSFAVRVIRSLAEAVDAVQHKPCDVILIDIDTGQAPCIQHVQRLLEAAPKTRTIFVSARIEDDTVEKALQLGVKGLILKDDLHGELIPALREILNGGAWFPEEVRGRITVDSCGARLVSQRRTKESDISV